MSLGLTTSYVRPYTEGHFGNRSAVLTHEIRQPLAAIVANAHAALRWLSNERPNFDEARAALKAIVSAGHRAGEIARSLHSTIKKGSH